MTGGPRYSLISDLGQSKAGRGGRGGAWQRYRRPALVVGCVALQTLLTSVVWNYLVIHYHVLLERDPGPSYSPPAAAAQAAVLRSTAFWVLSYFWRLCHPQFISQVTLELSDVLNILFFYLRILTFSTWSTE